jgi:hypothetical protein
MARIALFASCALLVTAGFAAAESPQSICIDPHKSYNARSLNQHDVFVQTSIGKPRPPARLETSCINLEPAIGIGLSTSFICIGLGDDVVANTIDGHVEHCVVTRVRPYAPEKGDKNT